MKILRVMMKNIRMITTFIKGGLLRRMPAKEVNFQVRRKLRLFLNSPQRNHPKLQVGMITFARNAVSLFQVDGLWVVMPQECIQVKVRHISARFREDRKELLSGTYFSRLRRDIRKFLVNMRPLTELRFASSRENSSRRI